MQENKKNQEPSTCVKHILNDKVRGEKNTKGLSSWSHAHKKVFDSHTSLTRELESPPTACTSFPAPCHFSWSSPNLYYQLPLLILRWGCSVSHARFNISVTLGCWTHHRRNNWINLSTVEKGNNWMIHVVHGRRVTVNHLKFKAKARKKP